MAVSLDDAWNETELLKAPLQMPQNSTHSISAKPSAVDTKLGKQEDVQERQEQIKLQQETILFLEAMVSELQNIRKEEAKRFTIYLVVACILFAVLYMYLDKLQLKIKDLTMNFRRSQWIQMNKNPFDFSPGFQSHM